MQRPIKFILGVIALTTAFVAPRHLRADDADKNDALPEVGIIAVRSFDALQSFIKQTGNDLPPGFDAASIEAQFPFIGKGGFDTSRPIGIIACGAPGLELQQMGGFAIPVKPTGGLLESIKAMGATPMPDHPDTVLLGGTALRRTADYLIFSPTPKVAVSVDTKSLLSAVKGPNVLLRYEWNFKAIRTSMPEEYKKIAGYMDATTKANPNNKDEISQKSALMVVDGMMKWMDTVDRADMAVESGLAGVKLVFSATPIPAPNPEPADLPGMPEGTFARLDINAVPLESMAAARTAMHDSMIHDLGEGMNWTADQKKQANAIGQEMLSLMLDPAATSFAGGTSGNEPVLYIVQHWGKPTDFLARFEKWMKDADSLPTKQQGKETKTETEHYSDGDLKVLRLKVTEEKSDPVYVDFAQKENDVLITVSKSDKHIVKALAGTTPLGPMKHIMAGSVDLGKTVELIAKLPDSPMALMPEETRTKLAELLKDQTVTVSTGSSGETGKFEITISKELLRKSPKLIEILSSMPDAKSDRLDPAIPKQDSDRLDNNTGLKK